MKFATLGHLVDKNTLKSIPKEWIKDDLIISPELDINGTKGHITGLTLTAKQMLEIDLEKVRKHIFDAAMYLQEEYGIDLIQLGALTTSVTSGGMWFAEQEGYEGFVNHGDSYTAAITCQAVKKSLKLMHIEPSEKTLAIVGAYGVIGEAVSKKLVKNFRHSILIGPREEKLKELQERLSGSFTTTTELKTKEADIIVTATNHPKALLDSHHLKKNVIVVDVSQPVNVSKEVCIKRPDIIRVDGGYVDFPIKLPIPEMPPYKNFACIAEVVMQAMENEKKNHVGSIEMDHLEKTEEWGKKYGFLLNDLTNFGEKRF